jgi:hypothetical protein
MDYTVPGNLLYEPRDGEIVILTNTPDFYNERLQLVGKPHFVQTGYLSDVAVGTNLNEATWHANQVADNPNAHGTLTTANHKLTYDGSTFNYDGLVYTIAEQHVKVTFSFDGETITSFTVPDKNTAPWTSIDYNQGVQDRTKSVAELYEDYNSTEASSRLLLQMILAEERRAKGVEGNLDDLTTTTHKNLVFAVNEVKADTVTNANAIVTEMQRAELAENTNAGRIDRETQRATNAESALNQSIEDETSRAETAENGLQANIDHETDRAENEEQTLSDAIGDLANASGNIEQGDNISITRTNSIPLSFDRADTDITADRDSTTTLVGDRNKGNLLIATAFEFDTAPTPGSNNAVYSYGIYTAIANAVAGDTVTLGGYYFAKTKTDTTPPLPTDAAQNYVDLSVEGQATPYTAASDLSGWTAGTPLNLEQYDSKAVAIPISKKFWDITDTNNVGGRAILSSDHTKWTFYPDMENQWNMTYVLRNGSNLLEPVVPDSDGNVGTTGNFVSIDSSGRPVDSGYNQDSFIEASASFVLQPSNGGTGITASPTMVIDLASNASVPIFAASPEPGVTGTLAVANGGTGATDLANVTVGYATNPASGGSFITSSNIGSQSVNYADSAGSASTATTAYRISTSNVGGTGAIWVS